MRHRHPRGLMARRNFSESELAVYPVNPIFLQWAAASYALDREFREYQDRVRPFISFLRQEGFLTEDPMEDGTLDEEVLHDQAVAAIMKAGKVQTGDRKTALLVQAEARKIIGSIGMAEEHLAATPRPDYGILGDGAATETLSQVARAAYRGNGWPVMTEGNNVYLVTGPTADASGRDILPIGSSEAEHRRAGAGLLLAVFTKLWAGNAFKSGAKLVFRVPEESPSASLFFDMVCPLHERFAGNGYGLTIGFNPQRTTVVGNLAQEGGSDAIRGVIDPKGDPKKGGPYLITVGRQQARLQVSAQKAILVRGDEKLELAHKASQRFCPGPQLAGAGIFRPPVLSWLAAGGESLLADFQDPKSRNHAGLVKLFSMEDPREVVPSLRALIAALPTLPMTVELVPEGGRYYGSEARIQSVPALRYLGRMQLSRTEEGSPPTFLYMDKRAEASEPRYRSSGRQIKKLRFELTVHPREEMSAEESEVRSVRPKRERRPAVVLPIGPENKAVISLTLTLWGARPGGPGQPARYQPVWQRTMDAEELEDTVDPEDSGRKLEVAPALRWLAMHESGLLKHLSSPEGSEPPPMPYALVVTMLVDIGAMGDLARRAPPAPVGKVLRDGRSVQAGIALAGIPIPGRSDNSRMPDIEKMKDWARVGRVSGLELLVASAEDQWKLARSVGMVGFSPSYRRLTELADFNAPSVFDFPQVSKSKTFERVLNRLRKMAEEESDEVDEDSLILPAYYATISGAASSGGGFAARRSRSRKEAESEDGDRVLAADEAAQKLDASPQSGGKGLFTLGMDVCKATLFCNAPLRTRKGSGLGLLDVWSSDMASYREGKVQAEDVGENLVLEKLQEYGIELEKPSDPVQRRDALVRLKEAMLEEVTLSMTPVEPMPSTPEGGQYMLDELSRLNPSRRRPPRPPRRPRRHLRRNPIAEGVEFDEVLEYVKPSKSKKPKEPGRLPEVFGSLTGRDEWEMTERKLDALLPYRSTETGAWSPTRRVAALKDFDFVSRLRSVMGEVAEKGKAAAAEPIVYNMSMPFEQEAVRDLMAASASLSLDDAIRILAAQGNTLRDAQTRGGREKRAMQPSTAICKLYRSRRLKEYQPPNAVMKAADRALILISPSVDLRPRVMSFRRGVHIDCDMVGANPSELPELLGRAIQSVLYWLVEKGTEKVKDSRVRTTNVYIGRVGEPFLYLAYRAGEPVTVAQVLRNLKRAQDKEPGFRVAVYPSSPNASASLRKDVDAYLAAAGSRPSAPERPISEELAEAVVELTSPPPERPRTPKKPRRERRAEEEVVEEEEKAPAEKKKRATADIFPEQVESPLGEEEAEAQEGPGQEDWWKNL